MATKDDTELDAWKYRFPSAGVSWNFTGDMAYCQQFVGEAKVMLYQLKNRMNLAVPKLKTLQHIQSYSDGMIITVRSVFGQDFVEINASAGGGCSCSITLFNVPTIVQPMRYPGEIKEFEVEGIDYIKTYYRVSFSPSCKNLEWNMLPNLMNGFVDSILNPGQQLSNYQTYKLRNPFVFKNKTIPLWYDTEAWRRITYPPPNPRPDDHSIHSYWDNCAAEIIEEGHDDKGRFIKWKAYTEWTYNFSSISLFGRIQSRTGLGYMQMMPYSGTRIITDDAHGGKVSFSMENCKDTSIIKVDCCHKDADIRPVRMLWTQTGLGGFTWINGVKYWNVPLETGISVLAYYQHILDELLYVFPETFGSCVPIEWTLSGPGRLVVSETYGQSAQWFPPDDYYKGGEHCYDTVIISAKDRCGTTRSVTGTPCCPGEPLSIAFTSLYMTAGYTQALTAVGGCGPFEWALMDGGGTITSDPETSWIGLYHAPDENPGCTLNPTITVTDCCGETAEIKLAFGKTLDYTAARYFQFEPEGCHYNSGDHQWYFNGGPWARGNLGCDGTWKCYGSGIYANGEEGSCNPGPEPCCADECYFDVMYGWGSGCGDYYVGSCMGTLMLDTRTEDEKNEGCCPVNPFTGLPFD